MGQQISIGIAYKTNKICPEDVFQKIAHRHCVNQLFVEKKENEELFEKNPAEWTTKHWHRIPNFLSLRDEDFDIGDDLKALSFYPYVNKETKTIWLRSGGIWLNSNMNDLADIYDIPFCGGNAISDADLEESMKIFNYFLTPEAWNKAAEKLFFEDSCLFDRLQTVAPCNFYSRFKEETNNCKHCEDDEETDQDEYEEEYDPENDWNVSNIKTIMEVYNYYRIVKTDNDGDSVIFLATYA